MRTSAELLSDPPCVQLTLSAQNEGSISVTITYPEDDADGIEELARLLHAMAQLLRTAQSAK